MATTTTTTTVQMAKSLVQEQLSDSYSGLALFAVVFMLLLGIFVYGIFNIVSITQFYYTQKSKFKSQRRPTSDNTTQAADDNETYVQKGSVEDVYDDYGRFSKHIDDTVAEYKSYNAQLKSFYADNRPGEQPQDIIDRGILDPKSDNY
jgi:hypothetical protein